MIDIRADYLEIIRGILAQHAPGAEARVFGSRVDGTAAKYSDVDIAIKGREKLSLETRAALRTAFEESDLPFRVDIMDWHGISGEFKKRIELRYETISA
jgi:predicted nucleotidyltransferase